jgi:hypothetical protein
MSQRAEEVPGAKWRVESEVVSGALGLFVRLDERRGEQRNQ